MKFNSNSNSRCRFIFSVTFKHILPFSSHFQYTEQYKEDNNPLPVITIPTSRPDTVNNIHFSVCMLATICFAHLNNSSFCVLQPSAQS